MNSAFRPHGRFSAHVEGPLFVSEVTGPWNKELVEYWGRYVYADCTELSKGGPYVAIALIRESMLCPVDALEALRQIVRYSVTRLNCIANVIVADASVDGRNFIEPVFARMYEGLVDHAFFYDMDEARAWSHELLRDYKPPAP